MKSELYFTNAVEEEVVRLYLDGQYDRCFVLCDENSAHCASSLLTTPLLEGVYPITIGVGDDCKNLDALSHVWQELSSNGATRKSLLINVGGGVVTDVGGFAAATFKRGIDFINIPTTLLGAVDAAVGGKTGINFAGLKNEVGAFCEPRAVVVATRFYATLPREELLSGYAEMLKHGIIEGQAHYDQLLRYDITQYRAETLLPLLQQSVGVKARIVAADFRESGLRKMLNLGHTVAHAFESHAMRRGQTLSHGYAVAWGLVCALILSHRLLAFSSQVIYDLARYVEQYYGAYAITCDDYDELIGYMRHDKKNENDKIFFSLMKNVGVCGGTQAVDEEEVKISLDFFRDLFHL